MNALILGHWEKLISKVVGSRTPRRRWVFVFIEKHRTYSWRLRLSHLSRCVLKQKQTCARINHAVAAHSCTSLWLVFWRAGRAFWRGKYPNWTVIFLIFCLCSNVHISDDNCHHLMGRVTLPNSKPSAMSSELQAQKAVALMCQTYSWGIRGKHCGQTRLCGRWAAKTQTRLLAWSNTTVAPFSVEQCEPEWHCCSCAVAVRRWLHGGFCSRVESECQSVGNGRSTLKIQKEKTFYYRVLLFPWYHLMAVLKGTFFTMPADDCLYTEKLGLVAFFFLFIMKQS